MQSSHNGIILADGGIETRIIYEYKRYIDNFEAFELLSDAQGREILRNIYSGYASVAAAHDLTIQLGTPTWRASRNWTQDVSNVNQAACALLRSVVQECAVKAIIAGVIGPASDGYTPNEALDADSAYAYHIEQTNVLARCGVDLLYAPTFPALSELLGIARAMAQTGVPYALAPMLRPDGTMLDGTPLGEAIRTIDERVSPVPAHYMIGCLYPTHALTALQATRDTFPQSVQRVRGLKANASPLSPEQLDKLGHLAATDPAQFAADELNCAREFDLQILGGCCGTDNRDIEAIAKLITRENASL